MKTSLPNNTTNNKQASNMASTTTEFSSDPVLIPEPVSDPVIVEDPKDESTQSVAGAGPAAAVKDMHVIIVQDVSGSMSDQRRSVQTGINEIIGELQTRYNEPCPHKATFCIITAGLTCPSSGLQFILLVLLTGPIYLCWIPE